MHGPGIAEQNGHIANRHMLAVVKKGDACSERVTWLFKRRVPERKLSGGYADCAAASFGAGIYGRLDRRPAVELPVILRPELYDVEHRTPESSSVAPWQVL